MSRFAQSTSIQSVFSFDSTEVRLLVDNQGEPWFCATDVCAVLGYQNAPDAVTKHCRQKGIAKHDTLTKKGQQSLTFLNEGNLYRLIIKSHLPAAERFEAWVCDEVLPAIRKTGRYEATPSSNPMSDEALTNLRLSNPQGQWLLSFEADGRAYLKQIERYSILVEPKYLFKLIDAAREIEKFDAFFGLNTHYAPLREPCNLNDEGRICADY